MGTLSILWCHNYPREVFLNFRENISGKEV